MIVVRHVPTLIVLVLAFVLSVILAIIETRRALRHRHDRRGSQDEVQR